MSNNTNDDESSRLKHFIWEELDENFYIAVIFRSNRRYIVQRHFEQQLFDLKSPLKQNKWRHCLMKLIANSVSPIYIKSREVELMHEILSWHLNYSNNCLKLRENIDYLIDFEDLVDCFNTTNYDGINNSNNNDIESFIQPVTTLDAARKNIEVWKNLKNNSIGKHSDQSIEKRVKRQKIISKSPISAPSPISASVGLFQSSLTGWIQLDSKLVPFIKKYCDRLLPVEYLLKEHIISASEDFALRSLYIPINNDDIQILNQMISQSSRIDVLLTNYSSLITLDHLIFRLKRLFFIRFVSSPSNLDYIDYNEVVSLNGGLLTLINNTKQRIPFVYINKVKYIPQISFLNMSFMSTFAIPNKFELEYLRLVALYDYLSSDENNDNIINLLSSNNVTLISIDYDYERNFLKTISLYDFHYSEYQRRFRQQKSLVYFNDNQQFSNGWWQSPVSSSSSSSSTSSSNVAATKDKQRSLSQFKLQPPIFF